MTMEARKDHDFLSLDDVEHTVGKSPEQGATHFAMDLGTRAWVPTDGGETLVKGLKELAVELMTALQVP